MLKLQVFEVNIAYFLLIFSMWYFNNVYAMLVF